MCNVFEARRRGCLSGGLKESEFVFEQRERERERERERAMNKGKKNREL